MANQAAIKFVRQLWAAFCRYPISVETKELYGMKLSTWRLTQPQWDKALDDLIAKHEVDSLPTLNEIYGYLKRAEQSSSSDGSHLGWASFRIDGRDYAIRVKIVGGTWVIADLVHTDAQGNKTHLQQHVGDPVVNHIPGAASDYVLSPDNPGRPKIEDTPTLAEVHQIVRGICERVRI